MRGCVDLFCHDDVCRSYIGKRFHAALVMVECLSAAITQRQCKADGPHMRGDGPESAYGMVSLVQSAMVEERHTPHDRHGEQRHTKPHKVKAAALHRRSSFCHRDMSYLMTMLEGERRCHVFGGCSSFTCKDPVA